MRYADATVEVRPTTGDGPGPVIFHRRQTVGWPVRLEATSPAGDRVVLRPLTAEDEPAYLTLRRENAAWLAPWDATQPNPAEPGRTYTQMLRTVDEEADAGRALPFGIEVGGSLAGQVNLSNIVMGSFRSCNAGYWIARAVAGRGVMPTALAAAADHAFFTVGLHRLEVNIRPENAASLAVVRKLGLRDEGIRERYLHIAGSWCDHRSFAVTVEELDGGRLADRLTAPNTP
ncbi:Ribosomal-protein-alanine N-acetyltransferase [Nostocoides japonicum T1-X7]|uniref:Ribosomal-protein-alanine N-acetyltransferase n=2 Tax=Nostocoides japonicum TaxID=99481 RepID=A0A077LUI8_9MICO|nr:Ribosomal-protein-alanine N-acetyltransferase [Tetrasphaera japonica T1-X7]